MPLANRRLDVSGKLRGSIAISTKDLLSLCAHFKVPAWFFFSGTSITADAAREWDAVLNGPQDVLRSIVMASSLSDPEAAQFLKMTEAFCKLASNYGKC
jgi:hypothetical protein